MPEMNAHFYHFAISARSAVSTKMRKVNEFLNQKFKHQEQIDCDKEKIAKEIQIDLEERLTVVSNELFQMRNKLKSKFIT